MSDDPVTFSELATAAYCPRKLYYRRRDEGAPAVPERVARVRALADEYPVLLRVGDGALAERPIEVAPGRYRRRLQRLRERFADDGAASSGRPCENGDATVDWAAICDPAERDVVVTGRDCRGRVDKVLASGGRGLDGPPVPVRVSAGTPPPEGVWTADSVRAVAFAKALSYRDGVTVERTLVEYPAVAVIRELELTTRRKAAYRRALRTVRTIDGPPPRADDARCEACEYRAKCGVRTRSLKSLLGFG